MIINFSNSFTQNDQTFAVHLKGVDDKYVAKIILNDVEIINMDIQFNETQIYVIIKSHNLKIGLKNFDEKLKSLKHFMKKGFCDVFGKIKQTHFSHISDNLDVVFILEENKNKPIVEHIFEKIGLKKNGNGHFKYITNVNKLLKICLDK